MADVMTIRATFALQTQQFKANLKQATSQAKAAGQQISGTLGRSANRIKASFLSMATSIRSNLGKITVAAGAASVAFRNIAKDIDRLAKLARQIGVPIAVLQQLESAAGKSGVEVADLRTAMEFFQRATAEAKTGTGALASELGRLGIDAQQFASLPLLERVELIADEMAKMTNEVDKAGLASDAFGRSGQKLIIMLGNGSASLKQLRDDFNDVGYSISETGAAKVEEMNDALQRLGEAAKGAGQQLVTGLAVPLKAVADFFTALVQEARESRQPMFFGGIMRAGLRLRSRREVERERAASAQAAAAATPVGQSTAGNVLSPASAVSNTVGTVSTFFGPFKTGERDQLQILQAIKRATEETAQQLRFSQGVLT